MDVLALGGALWMVFLLLLCFTALSVAADKYLVPSIERICEVLHIPDEAAGASFLAFGSSAPEIVISIVAVNGPSSNDQPALGLSTALGSGIIAFGLIPSVCAFMAPKKVIELALWPLIRDVMFCILGFGSLGLVVMDGQVTASESVFLVTLFPVYMVAVFLPVDYAEDASRDDDVELAVLNRGGGGDEAEARGAEQKETPLDSDSEHTTTDSTQSHGESHALVRCLRAITHAMSWPFEKAFSYTIPDCSEERWAAWYPMTFLLSLVYIALFSWACLEVSSAVAKRLHIPESIEGLLVLALGAQVPDAIASFSMARHGHGGGAVSSAIGSQTISVLLGVGGPFWMYSLAEEKPVELEIAVSELKSICVGLIICMLAYLTLTLSGMRTRSSTGKRAPNLTPQTGALLFVVYIGVTVSLVAWNCTRS